MRGRAPPPGGAAAALAVRPPGYRLAWSRASARGRATKQGHTSPRVYFGRVSFGLPYLPSVRINRYSQFSRIFNVPEEDSSGVRIYSTFPIHTWTNKSGHLARDPPPHTPFNVEKMLSKKFATLNFFSNFLKKFRNIFRKNAKQNFQHCLGCVGGVFISGQLRSVRIYLSTPEISLDTKIDRTWHTAENHRHPESSSGSCTSGHFAIPLLLYSPKQ